LAYDWSNPNQRYIEEIAYSRSLEAARRAFGLPVALPESATLSAALTEVFSAAAAGQIINAKAAPYNALGDGVTDDTAAIQAALIAASLVNGDVFLPAGTYISTGLSIYSNTRLRGVGRGTVVKLKPSIDVATVTVLLSNSANYPLAGNVGIGVSDLTLDGSYVGGTASPASSQVLFLSLVTDSFLRNVRIINARRNGLTLEFCKRVEGDVSVDFAAVNGVYLSGSDRNKLQITSRRGGQSGSGACVQVSNSWFNEFPEPQLTEPAVAGALAMQIGNDSQENETTGGFIEGLGTINTQMSAVTPAYYVADHPNAPVYDSVTYQSASNNRWVGTRFSAPAGQNVNAVTLIRGGYNDFIGCKATDAWGYGFATYGSKENKFKSCTVARCGRTDRGTIASTQRYAFSFDFLDATYPGTGNVAEDCECYDDQPVPTMYGFLVGPSATPVGTVIKRCRIKVGTNPFTQTSLAVRVIQERNTYNTEQQGVPQLANATATTVFTFAAVDAIYYAVAGLTTAPAASGATAVIRVSSDGSAAFLSGTAGGGVSFTLVGLALKITQASGAPAFVDWSIVRDL
jgi:hypothetical protein